jgi:hypothetical protein
MTIIETIAAHPVAATVAVLSTAYLALLAVAPAILGTKISDSDDEIETVRDIEKREAAEQAAKDEAEYGPLK